MSKPKVYATHQLFAEAREILDAACEMEYWTNEERPPREEVLRLHASSGTTGKPGGRYDNIDLDACTKHGVAATNTPGVLDETTADFAWTLMMAVARRLGEGEQLARSGNWKGWNLDQLCGADVCGP